MEIVLWGEAQGKGEEWGVHVQKSLRLRRFFHDGDFFGRQVVELINELVNRAQTLKVFKTFRVLTHFLRILARYCT